MLDLFKNESINQMKDIQIALTARYLRFLCHLADCINICSKWTLVIIIKIRLSTVYVIISQKKTLSSLSL